MLLIVSVLFKMNVHAQRTCAAHDHMLQQMEKSPKMRKNVEKLQRFTKNYVENKSMLKSGQVRIIPVYVHVIYSNSKENISDAQIQSQIEIMNLDYGGVNPDISGVPSEFLPVTSTGTGISFVLVGVTRKNSTRTEWGTNDDMKKSSVGGVNPITPETHMNMWICNIGGGILGYAQFPGGSLATDGVVFSPQFCGSSDYDDGSFYLTAPFDKGRTAVHEIGHYLNLRHIWGDGDCSATDHVHDTPSAEKPNYSCPSHPHSSCGSNDMFMNYMDYVDDDCMYMFSQGQSDRMWACLNSTRASLGFSDGNIAPIAKANGPYTGDPNVAISFNSSGSNDLDGSIVTYTWDFGDGNTSIQANPSHTYQIEGIYNLSLTVTDDLGKSGIVYTTVNIGNVCSGAQACDENITLTLMTDNYGSETSWVLMNSAGSIVESGSDYESNTTYTFNWALGQDAYTFIINDEFGDGICCDWGNGSYTLKDGCDNVLKSGGEFSSSESIDFCITGNFAPTVASNGPYFADEEVVIDFSSAGSEDSDGFIQSYDWNFGDGNTSTEANPTHAYTHAGNYIATLAVTDDGGLTATDVANVTITELSTFEENYFESGWNGWSDGGSDCVRYRGPRSYEGDYSIRLRDNSGSYSAVTSSAYNLNAYKQTTVDFYFYSHSMEEGEDFWLRYFDGSSWTTVESWVSGTDFNNEGFYHATVSISSLDYTFPPEAKFRFQCDASGNTDYIYIDQLTITASLSAQSSDSNIELVSNQRRVVDIEEDMDLVLYPNPVEDILYVKLNIEEEAVVNIFNVSGQLVKALQIHTDETPINVSELASGVYLLKVTFEDEVFVKRFVKK